MLQYRDEIYAIGVNPLLEKTTSIANTGFGWFISALHGSS
jgi:hypothetical protein